MKYLQTILLSMLYSCFCSSQVLQYQVEDTILKNWGGIYNTKIDHDGNVVSVYQSHWAGDAPMSTLLKTDKQGNVIWSKYTYGLVSAIEIADSATYVGLGMNASDAAFITTSQDTGVVYGWLAGFTPYSLNVQRNGLAISRDRQLLICGNNGFTSGIPQIDGYIFRIGYDNRQLLWAKRYQSNLYMQHVYFNSIVETANNIYILGGTRYADAEMIYKLDSIGNPVNSYRLDSVITIDTVEFKYRYFDKIRNVNEHLYITCRFKDTNRAEKHEAYFVGKYDTSTNSMTGKVFHIDSMAKFDMPVVCFVDTNIYYLAFRLSGYDALVLKIKNDSVIYAKNFRAKQPLRFCSIDYQDDSVVIAGNYGSKAYYAVFDDSSIANYTLKTDDTTQCQVLDTMIHSINATFYMKTGQPIYTANIGGISQVMLDKSSVAVHNLTRICKVEDTASGVFPLSNKAFVEPEIYPNPCKGSFKVRWNDVAKINSIKVVNYIGHSLEINVLTDRNGFLQVELPKNVASGIYICIIETQSDRTIKKIFIE